MKKKQFKSESKRLLDLMINSIYTNNDIFLRELISNASDALDKLYYRSLTDKKIKVKKENLKIKIETDNNNRILTITDNGIGMTKDELEENLGTIAKSGSLSFKEMNDSKKIDIIGQFGVGFYSAFMVSKKIEVISKTIESDKAYKWTSDGIDGYEIEETEYNNNGTKIILHIKEDTDDVKYSEYLEEYKLRELIKKYSDYISYPIVMEVTKYNEKEETKELETINSMVPLWKKNKKNIKEEEYDNFYQDKFYDFEKPLKVIHTSAEGLCSYKAILFIPSHEPYDFYSKDYEKGLSLYSNGVLIMDKCSELLPDYLAFIKGVVDTEDISLNISREMLQQTKSLRLIAKNIENKILKELESMLKEDQEKYKKFYEKFGIQLKFGVYNNYGMDKDKLKDLLLFYSSKKKDLITLKEYVENIKENQDNIYYVSGETIDKIDTLPQTEQLKEKDYDILYLTDYIDEFVMNTLREYDGKKFVNISNEELDLEDEQEKQRIEKFNEENKEMLDFIKESLDVEEVKFTNKLKKHPVCLKSKGDISTKMEQVINALPNNEKVKAKTILEINENHKIVKKLQKLYKENKEELIKYAKILYSEARLIEGLPIENPTELSNLICDAIAN
ncbi:MAG: molecular chaperone HtpG [Bacilli bacterium]|nr:molecular chaperone HtpG [Bacilli bacterium]